MRSLKDAYFINIFDESKRKEELKKLTEEYLAAYQREYMKEYKKDPATIKVDKLKRDLAMYTIGLDLFHDLSNVDQNNPIPTEFQEGYKLNKIYPSKTQISSGFNNYVRTEGIDIELAETRVSV